MISDQNTLGKALKHYKADTGPISHCKCDGMVENNNSFVLNVSDFGPIVDMVLAIPALLGDGIGVPFPRGWDTCTLTLIPRLSAISPELMNRS